MKQYDRDKSIKYIQDRWLNQEFEYIALRYRGQWILYKKEGYIHEQLHGAEQYSDNSFEAYNVRK